MFVTSPHDDVSPARDPTVFVLVKELKGRAKPSRSEPRLVKVNEVLWQGDITDHEALRFKFDEHILQLSPHC